MMAMGTVIRMSLDDNTLALVVSKQTELRAAIGYCTLPMAVRAFITGGQGSAVPAQPSGGPCEVCKTPVGHRADCPRGERNASKRSVHEMARDIVAAKAIPNGARYKWREIGETGDGEEFDTSTGEATGNKADGFFAWKVKERLGAKS